MGLKKELDVFIEFCRNEEKLNKEEKEEVLKAVETLKNTAEKIGY